MPSGGTREEERQEAGRSEEVSGHPPGAGDAEKHRASERNVQVTI